MRLIAPSPVALTAVALLAAVPGCIKTDSTIHLTQDKPLEANVNLNGKLELVIEDARQNLEQITGQKPLRTVNLEDIGLPPSAVGPAATGPSSMAPSATQGVLYLSNFAPLNADSQDQIKQRLAGRNAQIRALLDAQTAGEAHTGLVVARGQLSATQQQLVAAENADRTQLYQAEAQSKGASVDQVALSYYVARLGYAHAGDWVEVYDKASSAWNWTHWKG